MPADRPADHAAVGPSTEVNGRDDEPSDEPSDESDEHTAATGAAPGEDGDELDDEDDPPDVGEGYAAFYGGDGYLDWSSPQPAGGRSLELGFDADAVVLDLTEDELHSLIGELGAVLDNPDRDTGGLATDDGAIDLERNPDGTITIEFNRDDGERVTVTVPATHVRAAHAQLIEDLPARAHTPWCTGRHDPYGSCEAVEGLVDGARLELTGGRAATRLWIDGMNLTDVDQVDTVIAKLTAYRDRLANAPADPGPTAEPGNADGTPR